MRLLAQTSMLLFLLGSTGCIFDADGDDDDNDSCVDECDSVRGSCSADCDDDDNSFRLSCDADRDDCETDCV
jgi:hypothetical protein